MICPTISTGEWVTVAIGSGLKLFCTSDSPPVNLDTSQFLSLLPGTNAYTDLQAYQYSFK